MPDEEKSWFGQALNYGNEGFKMLVFDYEQVYNDPWSLSSAVEVASLFPPAKLLKVASKGADALKIAEKGVDAAKNLEKTREGVKDAEKLKNSKLYCPEKSKCSKKELGKKRRKGVKDAWAEERKLIEETGQGTRDWTPEEMDELMKTGKVKGYEGHHINNVNDHPDLADNPDNIKFVKGREEHLIEHGGNFKNPSKGDLIKRK